MRWPESPGFPGPPEHPGSRQPPEKRGPEAPQPGRLPPLRWGPGRAIGGLLAALVLTALAGTVAVAIDPGLESLEATLVLQAVVAVVFIFVAFYFASSRPGPVAAGDLGFRRPRGRVFGPAVGAYLLYIACALVITALLQPQQEDIARDLGLGEGVLGSIAAGVMIIVVASVTEEVFFRGFVFAGLRSKAPFAVAALVSAFVWALLHFNPENPEGSWGVVAQLTVLGVALSWLYERTGSIWPAIAVHSFNNALAFAVLAA